MKFKFKIQKYQTDAVEATARCTMPRSEALVRGSGKLNHGIH